MNKKPLIESLIYEQSKSNSFDDIQKCKKIPKKEKDNIINYVKLRKIKT